MGMAWPRGLSSSWLNVEALSCFGSLFLSLWLRVLVFLWPDLTKIKASGGGRARSCAALLLLSPLLLFSSFSFAASSITGFINAPGASCSTLNCSVACAADLGSRYLSGVPDSSGGCACTYNDGGGTSDFSSPPSCSVSCIPSSGELVVSSGMGQNGRAITGNFCDSNTGCVSSYFNNGSGGDTLVTSGSACVQCGSGFDISASGSCVAVTASAASTPASSCPSGYSLASGGCSCVSGSSYVAPSPLPSSCTPVGNPTAPVLSPVSPVTSNGVTSCPSGSSSVSSGSTISCFVIVNPPAANPQASPAPSGGGGGGSGFHITAPTQSSNGQYVCPPGASVIGGSTPGSMECIVSGPGPISAPTASGTSATSSASSAPSYPSSISMPALPGASVGSVSLGSIPGASESTSDQCPAPVTFDVMSHTFSITFTYACDLAARVRPVVIGAFSLASLLLIVK